MSWRRFFQRSSNIVGLALVLMFVIMAIFAPQLAPPASPPPPRAPILLQDPRGFDRARGVGSGVVELPLCESHGFPLWCAVCSRHRYTAARCDASENRR